MSIRFVNALGTKYMMLMSASCERATSIICVSTSVTNTEHDSLTASLNLGEGFRLDRVVVVTEPLELVQITADAIARVTTQFHPAQHPRTQHIAMPG